MRGTAVFKGIMNGTTEKPHRSEATAVSGGKMFEMVCDPSSADGQANPG